MSGQIILLHEVSPPNVMIGSSTVVTVLLTVVVVLPSSLFTTIGELQKTRGVNSIYHNNSIATWLVSKSGKVDNVRLG